MSVTTIKTKSGRTIRVTRRDTDYPQFKITKSLVTVAFQKTLADEETASYCVLNAVSHFLRVSQPLDQLPLQGDSWAWGCIVGFDGVDPSAYGKSAQQADPKAFAAGRRFGRWARQERTRLNNKRSKKGR